MKEKGCSVIENLSKLQNGANQLATIKIILDDELQVLLLLNSLLDSQKILIESLNNLALVVCNIENGKR